MDKMPSLSVLWLWCLCASIIGGIATWWKKWMAFITLPLPLYYYYGVIQELHDPHVGQAVFKEAGYIYFTGTYLAVAIVVVAHLVMLLRKKKA
ncbi:MAG: hypothetical protein AB7L92_08390 [Alphaproteobacteria bacterium]